MTAVKWDAVGERVFETGVDHGVLYKPDNTGAYEDGVAWNGLVTVTESPSGAEATPQYADNIKYLNLVSAEQFAGTIEAFTYPQEFEECDGSASPAAGLTVQQQSRKPFGLSYRTLKGNDVDGTDFGYKLHFVYGALAAPSEKARSTVNDTPEAVTFSWEFSTTGVEVPGLKPSAHLVLDSTTTDAAALAQIEAILYGDEANDPRLPLPTEVMDLLTGVTTVVRTTGANAPTYNAGTHVLTLPAVAGVTWLVDGEETAAGAQPALAVGESAVVEARANEGYAIDGDDDWVFDY